MSVPDCNKELRKNGMATMSRTCARCDLGPCRPSASLDSERERDVRMFAPIPNARSSTFILPSPVVAEALKPPATPEQIANAIDANDTYPWSKGDTQILLRSFIFEHLSTPQSTLDFKKEIPALQAYVEWIMTGSLGPSGSKLKVVV